MIECKFIIKVIDFEGNITERTREGYGAIPEDHDDLCLLSDEDERVFRMISKNRIGDTFFIKIIQVAHNKADFDKVFRKVKGY